MRHRSSLVAAVVTVLALAVPAGGAAAATSASHATVAPAKKYTMSQVKAHSRASSCWSVVNGRVYNLTGWISRHPGGSSRILAMCGKDASAAFNAQHGRSSRAQSYLASYRIGRLA
jgi:cytochrome b involved in lipid metabolism